METNITESQDTSQSDLVVVEESTVPHKVTRREILKTLNEMKESHSMSPAHIKQIKLTYGITQGMFTRSKSSKATKKSKQKQQKNARRSNRG